ncbi:MAG: GDP-mannose 4,6-dehydratase [Chloroflexi bacterium]|nr:GDP-mannose 4,6-dehydratase [Chloroflexota bacterium]
MRVLITGVAGFAGRHLAAHLFAQGGHEIWGLSRAGRDVGGLDPAIRMTVADLMDRDSVEQAVADARPDAVYHLASQASVMRSFESPLETLQNNIVGQVHLLDACVKLAPEARILVIGSNEEYGLTDPSELPIEEHKELRPVSPYAVSKVTQDMLGHQYFRARMLQVVRARPFTHIGPGQAPGFVTTDFAQQVARMELCGAEPRMAVGNLSGVRDFSDVRDIVRGYRLLIERGEPGEVYNLGSGVGRTIQSILDDLLVLTTVRPEVVVDPARMRPSEIPAMYADCSKIEAATGWRTEIPFEQTLRDVLDDWRARVRA